MSQRHRTVATNGRLVAFLLVLFFAGCSSPEEGDTQAIQSIVALGGKIVQDDNLPGKPVISVEFTKLTDAGLKEVAGLKKLTTLNLTGTQVTDVGLKELAGLQRLATLNLSRTQVTDAGLKELVAVKNLHRLDLTGTRVTQEGVAGLQKSLRYCDIVR
jgi:internalin A